MANCTSTHCKKCDNKHNTLLHSEEKSQEASQQVTTNVSSDADKGVTLTSTIDHCHVPAPSQVILSTAQVWIHDKDGTRVDCKVLLDSGSQINFISQDLCRRLRLHIRKQSCSIKGLCPAITLNEATGAVIQSKHTAYQTKLRFIVTQRPIERLPLTAVEINHLQIPSNIKLADNKFHIPGRVDVILGASIF